MEVKARRGLGCETLTKQADTALLALMSILSSARNRPQPRRFTPPRKLGEESGSEYSDSEYSDSDYSYSDSEEYSDGYVNGQDPEENEYLRNVRVSLLQFLLRVTFLFIQEAARAKQLRAKFEEWEAGLGEDGGYTNLVDENGLPLETASKLKNR